MQTGNHNSILISEFFNHLDVNVYCGQITAAQDTNVYDVNLNTRK